MRQDKVQDVSAKTTSGTQAKKKKKKRKVQNRLPTLSDDKEADIQHPKRQRKRGKASLLKGKTSVQSVHGKQMFESIVTFIVK